jgi:hypothetical protein
MTLNNSMVHVLLDNSTDRRLIKKYPTSSGTTEFTSVHTTTPPPPLPVHSLRHNPALVLIHCSFSIHFNIIPSTHSSSKWNFPFKLFTLNFYMYFPCLAGVLHVPTSSSPCCGRPIIFGDDYAYELQRFLISSDNRFSPFRSNYYCQLTSQNTIRQRS